MLQVIDVLWFDNNEDATTFTAPTTMCPEGKCYADCGPAATPPCSAWHKDPIPLTSLRAAARLTRIEAGRFQWQSPGARQALLALVAQDRQDGVEVGCSAAWHAGRR